MKTLGNMQKFLFKMMSVFLIAGLILVSIGVIAAFRWRTVKRDYMQVSGIIENIESHGARNKRHDVTVRYEIDGSTYSNYLGFYTAGMREGDDIKLYVNPDDYNKVTSKGSYVVTISVCGGLGIIFIFVALVIMVSILRENKKEKDLTERGRCIYATIDGIEIDYRTRVGGRHPMKLRCIYKDEISGEERVYYSKNMWEAQSENYRIGDFIKVYIDDNNPNKYFVVV